jgi:DnaJ-class molecular chaperone
MKKENILYYYKILGLNEKANDAEIKKTYRKLIFIWHPDKNINNKEESEKKTKEITEAYRIIIEYREKFKTKSKKAKPKQKQKKQKQTKKTKTKSTKKQQKSTKTKPKVTKAEVDKEILNFLRTFLNTYHDSK